MERSSKKSFSKKHINNNILFNINIVKQKNISKEKNTRLKKRKNSNKNDIYFQTNSKNLLYSKSNYNEQVPQITDNEFKREKLITKLNDQEINNLEYNKALKYDKRTYFQYYWSLIKKKQLILFTFIPNNDYNLSYIKIALFIVSFSLYFTINGFFFSDDTMHKVYEDNGEYKILYQIPQILFSSVISSVINIILKQLSLSEKNILKLKEEKVDTNTAQKSKKLENCLKIKFLLFFILSFILMLFFWYFISCFCAVYKNTQIILIKDTLISFSISMLYPFGLNLLPGFFRIPALRAKNKDKKCIYDTSLIIALI